MADFGSDDVEKEEAAIESGAPLEIPEVPAIPQLPQEVADGKLAADVSASEIDAAQVPKQQDAAAGSDGGTGGAANPGA